MSRYFPFKTFKVGTIKIFENFLKKILMLYLPIIVFILFKYCKCLKFSLPLGPPEVPFKNMTMN